MHYRLVERVWFWVVALTTRAARAAHHRRPRSDPTLPTSESRKKQPEEQNGNAAAATLLAYRKRVRLGLPQIRRCDPQDPEAGLLDPLSSAHAPRNTDR